VILRVFFNRLWDMARTSKTKDEMRSEREMRMIATFITTMLSSTGLKPKTFTTLSPMVEKN